MTETELINKLVSKGYNTNASATQPDLYSVINCDQLFSASNRLNAGWARGKYVIARFNNTTHTKIELVDKWVDKVQYYGNQILCLEFPQNVWTYYDHDGNEVSLNIQPPYFGNRYVVKLLSRDKLTSIVANLLTALRTKPFLLLAGISGTGKSRIVRELAFKSCPSYLRDADGTTPGNYCMIEVKPNWHDSSELLGYYSNISRKYVFTKFVKFLVKAMMYPNVPFFVCLDEMNLAPVEQYFAEFLSVLETRKLVGETIMTGCLVEAEHFCNLNLHQCKSNKDVYMKLWETAGENIESDASTSDSLLTVGLTLPENVFVIGTVNMDDTTHQFSRKVIDRAMTIEMNGGNLEDIFGGSKTLEYPEEADDEILSMKQLKARYVSADDVLVNCEKVKSSEEAIRFFTGKDAATDDVTLPKKLREINDVLKNTPFQVSYRVFNELVIYLAVLLDEDTEGKDIKELADIALDKIMLMKILPRIEGDYEMFNPDKEDNKLVKLKALFDSECESHKKLEEMIQRLETTEFTRFWP